MEVCRSWELPPAAPAGSRTAAAPQAVAAWGRPRMGEGGRDTQRAADGVGGGGGHHRRAQNGGRARAAATLEAPRGAPTTWPGTSPVPPQAPRLPSSSLPPPPGHTTHSTMAGGEVMNDAVAAPSTGDPATAVELPPPPAGGGGAYTASPLIMLPRESPCSSGGGGASLAARLERRHAPRISFHRVGDQHTARRLSPPQRGGHRRVHPVVAVAGALPARAGRRPTNWAGEIRPELSARKCTSVRRGLPAAVGRGHAPLDASVVGHFGRSVGRHVRVPADAHSRRRDQRRQRPPSPPPSPLPLLPLPLLLLSMPLSSSVTTALPHHPQTDRSQRNVRARADRRRDEEHIPRQKVDPAPH